MEEFEVVRREKVVSTEVSVRTDVPTTKNNNERHQIEYVQREEEKVGGSFDEDNHI